MINIVNEVSISGEIQGFKAGADIRALKTCKTKKGVPMVFFNLKHNEKTYFQMIAFDKVAEAIVRINKDRFVVLKGTLKISPKPAYADGERKWETQIIVSEITHSPEPPQTPPDKTIDDLPW